MPEYRVLVWYKGSAPRVANAARYAHARKNTIKCGEDRKKTPMI